MADTAPPSPKKEEKHSAAKAPAASAEAVLGDTTASPVKKVKVRRIVPEAIASIRSSYNNTIITISDPHGRVLAWSSAGCAGFAGTRKSTSYAASQAAQRLVERAKAYGVERVHVKVKGIGSGREQAIRSLQVGGLNVLSIRDVTPIPHGGCRPRKPRRV
jgi:small subunit ribosomal protein S11